MAKKQSALNKVVDAYSESTTNATPVRDTSTVAVVPEPKPKRSKKRKEEKYHASSSPLNKLAEGGYTPSAVPVTPSPVEKEYISETEKEEKRSVFPRKHSVPKSNEVNHETGIEQSTPPTTEEHKINYDEFEYEIDLEDQLNARNERKRAQRRERVEKVKAIAMVMACAYLLFLTYGALNTSYAYDDNGKIYAQKLTVAQIQALNDFEKVANEYRQVRNIYEAALTLDYRIAAGIEDPLLIAPEYERLLEQIDGMAIQCQAMTVSTQYTQLQSMLTYWITTDIAVYCQNMSAAISRDDATKAEKALEYRTAAYNDFSVITANITTMGATVEGADISDITDWSPEKYINQQIGDIGGNLS